MNEVQAGWCSCWWKGSAGSSGLWGWVAIVSKMIEFTLSVHISFTVSLYQADLQIDGTQRSNIIWTAIHSGGVQWHFHFVVLHMVGRLWLVVSCLSVYLCVFMGVSRISTKNRTWIQHTIKTDAAASAGWVAGGSSVEKAHSNNG